MHMLYLFFMTVVYRVEFRILPLPLPTAALAQTLYSIFKFQISIWNNGELRVIFETKATRMQMGELHF